MMSPMKTVSKDTNIPIYAKIFTDSIAKDEGAVATWHDEVERQIAEGLSQ